MSLVLSEDSPLYQMSSDDYITRKIEQEEESASNQESKTTLASIFKRILEDNRLDDALEILNAFISFMLAFTFAIESYY